MDGSFQRKMYIGALAQKHPGGEVKLVELNRRCYIPFNYFSYLLTFPLGARRS